MSTHIHQPIVTEETAKRHLDYCRKNIRNTRYPWQNPNFYWIKYLFCNVERKHCSYKNSIKILKKLPRKGKALLVEAGEENAGLVDIGDGWACAFKIESHNHPSAVEPFRAQPPALAVFQRYFHHGCVLSPR